MQMYHSSCIFFQTIWPNRNRPEKVISVFSKMGQTICFLIELKKKARESRLWRGTFSKCYKKPNKTTKKPRRTRLVCLAIPVHRCTDVPVYLCTGEPVYQSTLVPVYYPNDVLVHQCMHRCTDVPLYQCTSIPV